MIERELKRHLEGKPVIANSVGGIYAGRIPRSDTAREAILIRQISAQPTYGLYGEDTVVSPILQIDLISKNEASASILFALFENVRKTLNEFAKAPGLMGEIWVVSINIVSEGVTLIPSAVGVAWKRQRTFDIQIMHEQATEFA